jgi:hypothetical protein
LVGGPLFVLHCPKLPAQSRIDLKVGCARRQQAHRIEGVELGDLDEIKAKAIDDRMGALISTHLSPLVAKRWRSMADTLEEYRDRPDLQEYMRAYAGHLLEGEEYRERPAILDCIAMCFYFDFPVPAWVKNEFSRLHELGTSGGLKSWDKVFGRPITSGRLAVG